MRRLFLVLAASSALLGLLLPSGARACSYVAHVIESYPRPDETGIPLDAVPWVFGILGELGHIRIEDEGGGRVEVDVTQWQSGPLYVYEIAPLELLAPSTRYELVLSEEAVGVYTDVRRLPFTTGEDLSDEPLQPPPLESMQAFESIWTGCNSTARFCAPGPASGMVELALIPGGAAEPRGVYLLRDPTDLTGVYGQSGDWCVEARGRAANGVRSASVTTFCRSDATVFVGDEYDGWAFECVGGRLSLRGELLDETRLPVAEEPDPAEVPEMGSAGCRVAAGSTGAGWPWAASAVLLVAGALWRWKHRARMERR